MPMSTSGTLGWCSQKIAVPRAAVVHKDLAWVVLLAALASRLYLALTTAHSIAALLSGQHTNHVEAHLHLLLAALASRLHLAPTTAHSIAALLSGQHTNHVEAHLHLAFPVVIHNAVLPAAPLVPSPDARARGQLPAALGRRCAATE